jgi:dGTPase
VRCLEAQVMDWADDVAYSVHDVEDGVHSSHIRLAALDDAERIELCEQAAILYSPLPAGDLAPILDALLDLPALRDLAAYDGSYGSQAAAKRATSELTGRFVGSAVAETRAKYGDGPLGRYDASLIVPAEVAAECALLKAIAYRYVMQRSGVAELLTAQRQILTDLVSALVDSGEGLLATIMRDSWRSATSDAERLRVVVDQVAQLTDSAAMSWYRKLVRSDA